MTNPTTDTSQYSHALEQVRYEGQLLWQIFGAFLLAHTVFVTFLLQSAFEDPSLGFQPSVFYPALLGAILCLPWYASYSRSSDYYIFRMAQASALEPEAWNLIRGQGKAFSAGDPVLIAGESYRINWFGRVLRTKRSVPILVISFITAYASLIIWRGPW